MGVLMKVAHHGTRILTLATSLGLCGVLLVPRLTGDASVTLVSMHPVFMTLGLGLFASLGVTTYVSDFGGLVRALRAGSIAQRRSLNLATLGAAVFAVLGYLVRFVATQRTPNATHLPGVGDATWVKAHVYLGYAVLLGLALLVFIGFYKFVVRTRENVTIMQWHGHVGLVVWAAGLANIAVAVYGYFFATHSWLAGVFWAGLAGVLAASVLTVLFDPDRSQAAQLEGSDGDGGEAKYGRFEDETMMGSLYESSPARGSMNSNPYA